ncbi:mitochondrial ornithine transporter 1 [Moniliophthora roreri]|nr:mitochondrial ornithine transporter 1 [Moniliophthora roreri]
MSSKSSSLATINELLAGSVGGAAQVIVGQPLDTIKTRAQIAPKGMFSDNRWTILQKGPMDILTQTIRKEGFFALYKGMASPLIGIAGVNSLLFAAYGVSKRIISPYPQLSLPQIALAGAMAGAANAILASPVEMFKVRMQGQYGGLADKRLRTVAREMWSEWGFRKGVMRGYWITVMREIPAYAGFISIYGPELPVWALLASGSTGGIAYWLSCYPLDVIKSRVQLRPTPPSGTPVQYVANEVRMILAESGARGLFNGLSPSLYPLLQLFENPTASGRQYFEVYLFTRSSHAHATAYLKCRSLWNMEVGFESYSVSGGVGLVVFAVFAVVIPNAFP